MEGSKVERARPNGTDALGGYLRGLRDPIMTREEEHDVAMQLRRTGAPELAERLVRANLRLVVKLASGFRHAHAELLDLVQEGNLGLMHAVQKFDPTCGIKLSSYAAWWIRAYILKFIVANKRLVKVGTSQVQRKLFFALRKEEERRRQRGLPVEAIHLAQALGVREQDVVEMQQRLAGAELSFDAPMQVDDAGATWGDRISAAPSSRPDCQVEARLLEASVRDLLKSFGDTLDDRELIIFRDRLLNEHPATLELLGVRCGVTRERMRQIERRLKLRLRRTVEAELGDDIRG